MPTLPFDKNDRRSEQRPLAFFMPSLRTGGAERMTLNLIRGLARRGMDIDLVLAEAAGNLIKDLPESVRLVSLNCSGVRKAILPLARYLRKRRPLALVSRMRHVNTGALLARSVSLTKTPVLVVEASHLSSNIKVGLVRRRSLALTKTMYRRADQIIGVSDGVSRDLEKRLKLRASSVQTIYNPVIDEHFQQLARAKADHPWFNDGGPPVILAVGRMTPYKGFDTLLHAFAKLSQQRPLRLILLGDGEKREDLRTLSQQLNIADDVSMPGSVANPYSYMTRSAMLVHPSLYEGLPNVLIEALGCGCPVVATDCPSGPAEILDRGQYGSLVPVGDVECLAAAINETLDAPLDASRLRRRAELFSVDRAVDRYLLALELPVNRQSASTQTLPASIEIARRSA